jgi:hypothetical protein
MDNRNLKELLRRLDARDYVRRREALDALVGGRAPEAVDACLRLINDPHEAVRWGAAHGLGILRDPCAVPALTAALYDPALRDVARQSLEAIGTREAMHSVQRVPDIAAGRDTSGPFLAVRGDGIPFARRLTDSACAPIVALPAPFSVLQHFPLLLGFLEVVGIGVSLSILGLLVEASLRWRLPHFAEWFALCIGMPCFLWAWSFFLYLVWAIDQSIAIVSVCPPDRA